MKYEISDNLAALLKQLQPLREQPQILEQLNQTASAASAAVQTAIGEQVTAFAESGNPELLPEMLQHVADHTHEAIRLISTGRVGDLEFVRSNAIRRCEQGFPLEAVLHAYRCGLRHYGDWLRAAVSQAQDAHNLQLRMADFVLEYSNLVSTVAATSYAQAMQSRIQLETDQRQMLLRLLIAGHDEADQRLNALLRRHGLLRQRLQFCVIAADATESGELRHPARAQRLMDDVIAALNEPGWNQISGLHEGLAVFVITHQHRLSGWSQPSEPLSQQIQKRLSQIPPFVLAGISPEVTATSHLRQAWTQANQALGLANRRRRILRFADIDLQDWILEQAGDALQAIMPPWAETLWQLDQKNRGRIRKSLRHYAEHDMNMQRCAQALGAHANTLYARFARVRDATGKDPQKFNDLNNLLLALREDSNKRPANL